MAKNHFPTEEAWNDALLEAEDGIFRFTKRTLTAQEIIDHGLHPDRGLPRPQTIDDKESLDGARRQLEGDVSSIFTHEVASLYGALARLKSLDKVKDQYREAAAKTTQLPRDAQEGHLRPTYAALAAGYEAFFEHLGLDPKAILAEKGRSI